jgi:hypothetical protein
MSGSSRSQLRKALEKEITEGGCSELLVLLQNKWPVFSRFRSWTEVLAFMREGSARDAGKDNVLRPMLDAYRENRDPRWPVVMLALFRPALESVFKLKQKWEADQDELWQNVVRIFLEVLCRVDTAKRPNRLAQKIVNDTIHCLHDEYRNQWRTAEREKHAERAFFDDMEARYGEVEDAFLDWNERRNAEKNPSPAELERLARSYFGKKTAADEARELGISPAAAKKRRQRKNIFMGNCK